MTLFKSNRVFFASIIFSVVLSTFNIASAGSAIGNGGDIFSHYLEASRGSIREAIKVLIYNPKETDLLCSGDANLTEDQKSECRTFLTQTMLQILDLNTRDNKPALLLRKDPLLVEGPDGNPLEVDARTLLGDKGDIEVNFNRVQYYSPFQVFTLLTHEFGHKVLFQGHNVPDNSPTQTFVSGRALLDSAALALATYAQKRGIIGRAFQLLDHYSCKIFVHPQAPPVKLSGFSTRLFFNNQNFDRFETGIGSTPSQLDVSVSEATHSEIHFRMMVHEETGCRSSDSSGRWTQLSIVREHLPTPGQNTPPDEILVQERLESQNPVCQDPRNPMALNLQFQTIRFECGYTGSIGSSFEHRL